MRDTKKIYIIVAVCLLACIAGVCFWPTPERKDLSNLRSSMKIVQVYYEEIRTEIKTWRTNLNVENQQLAVNNLMSDFQYGVNQVIVPNTETSVGILQMTELTTPEVIALRDELVEVLALYSDASKQLLEGLKTKDEAMCKEAEQKLNQIEVEVNTLENNFKSMARKNLYFFYFY